MFQRFVSGSTSVVCCSRSGSCWPRSSPPATAPTRRRCRPRSRVCVLCVYMCMCMYLWSCVAWCVPMCCRPVAFRVCGGFLRCRSVLHYPQDRGVHSVHRAKHRPTAGAPHCYPFLTRAERRFRTRASSVSCPARRATSVAPPVPAAGRCRTRGARLPH